MSSLFVNLIVSFHVYKYIALASSFFLILQFVYSFPVFRSVQPRTILKKTCSVFRKHIRSHTTRYGVAWVFGYGWIGVLLYDKFDDKLLLNIIVLLLSLVVGIFMYFMMGLIYNDKKHDEFLIDDLVEKKGEVCVSVPPKGEGVGKVLIKTNASILEHEAITLYNYPIEKGRIVKVIGVENSTLIIMPIVT